MNHDQGAVLVGHIVEEDSEWSLDELCGLCAVESARILELVEQGVIQPRPAAEPRFGGEALRRVRVAVRLQRDLGINAAGTALALELLERIASLESELLRRR